MEYNLISNVESCYIQLPQLLYYSHWPSIIISLFFGLFVFFKSSRSLLGKILLLISISFSLWAAFDLIVWITINSKIYSFFWSFFEIFSILFYFLILYFGYVFIEEKDVSYKTKLFFLIIFIPVALISCTKYYFMGFDAATCDAIMNDKFLYYIYILKIIAFFGTVILLLSKYIEYKKDKIKRKKIAIAGFGLILLLLSFFTTQYVGDFISAEYYEIEFYGLFAIDIFIGFLAYLIVQYKAFDIKLIGAQALVIALVILVGSQFFFANNTTSMVLTGVTLALSLGFGYFLIRSVKLEVERKEQLQKMTDSLAQANDQLRILDNAKTEFISIASHQLRTPVTAIKGFASLLIEGSYGEVSSAVQGALEKVYISSERLANLIEDLLNVSRIESGRLTFEFANASVEKVLKELYENFLLIAKSKKLYLDLKLPEIPMPEIKMDAGKIRELISNFIDNALKYTEKGGATISAEMRESGAVIDEKGFVKEGEKAPYGGVIRITVSDTGIGVPKEEIPFLFRKFSRGKDTSRLHVGGTGLGLFVGKAIADAHHGATWVESDGAGKGSRFIIEIPIESQV